MVGLDWVAESAPVKLSEDGVWRIVVSHRATGVCHPSG